MALSIHCSISSRLWSSCLYLSEKGVSIAYVSSHDLGLLSANGIEAHDTLVSGLLSTCNISVVRKFYRPSLSQTWESNDHLRTRNIWCWNKFFAGIWSKFEGDAGRRNRSNAVVCGTWTSAHQLFFWVQIICLPDIANACFLVRS